MSIDFEDRLRAELSRDEVDVPFDLQAVIEEGSEKVRGRRLGWTVAGLAALAVVASMLTPLVIAGTVPAVPAPVTSPSATTAPSGLEDTVWQVTELNSALPTKSKPLTVQFSRGTVHGFGGCNTFSGLYTASGTDLRVGTLTVGATGCSGAVGAQERALLTAFGDARSVAATPNGMALLGANGKGLVALEPFDPSGLTWRLTDLAGEKQGTDTAFTLVIDGDHVRGTTTCGDFNADLARAGESWHVSGIFVTPTPCPSTASEAMTHFLAQLERATTWSLTPTTLRLSVPDGTALQFTYLPA